MDRYGLIFRSFGITDGARKSTQALADQQAGVDLINMAFEVRNRLAVTGLLGGVGAPTAPYV